MASTAGRVALLALGWTGCAPQPSEPPEAARLLSALDLPARVGQLLVVPLGGPGAALDSASLVALQHQVRQSGVGGVEVQPGDPARIAAALGWLRRAAPAQLLAVARLDDGGVPGGADFPAPAAVAGLATPEQARAVGVHLGRSARALGVDLALLSTAPTNGPEPLPLPARDPDRVARGLRALVEGIAEGGALPGVHALWSDHPGPVTLSWSRPRWDAIELPWLQAAQRGGAGAVQLGAVRVPGLTGDTVPLPFSEAAVGGMLRRDLGWRGPVIADVDPAGPLARGRGEAEAAVLALAAGADLLLGVRDPAAVTAAVVDAVRAGRLPRQRIDQAAARVLAFKLQARSLPPPAPADSTAPVLRDPTALALAESLAVDLSVRLAGPAGPAGLSAGDSGVVIATPVGRGETLARSLIAAVPLARHLRVNLTADTARVRQALADGVDSTTLLLTASFASREGPELAAVAAGAELPGRRIRALFRPWSMDAVLGDGPAVVSWGVGPTSQRAAARLLLGNAPPTPPPPGFRWPPAPMLRPAAAAEVGMDEEDLRAVDELLAAAVEERVVTGAALAVGRRGGLVRLRGYGRVGGHAVDPERTLFDLASLTKVVGSTAAAMLLVDAGVLELSAPVSRFLPEFRGEHKERVTVRHLLTHTSGLPSGLWLYGSARSPGQALRQVLREPLQRAPGERVEYSDLGMILLAEILERAAETPLDRLLARDLYAPLGMWSTQFLPPAVLHPGIVPTAARSERGHVLQGVVHDANAFRLGGVTGHAGLFSTARDVAVLAQTLLNGGAYGTVRAFSPEVVAAFSRKQPRADNRALGWDTPARRSSAGRFFSERSFGHTGFTGTSLWIDPERDLFVVLLTNRTYPEASAGDMFRLRAAVHDAVAQAISDQRVTRRPGAL